MKLFLFFLFGMGLFGQAHGVLAGGRPNSVSGGQNAFAGVSNPANAVWIPDRFDVGFFWVNQHASLSNHNQNPFFPPGKSNMSYKANNLYSFDAAIKKQLKFDAASRTWEAAISLAFFSTPTRVAVRTKQPWPIAGTTPIAVKGNTQVVSAIFSLKVHRKHSLGISIDYYSLSFERRGFQNSDNGLRSISPGHVTNNGRDHSRGIGISLGWNWRISSKLAFGIAWIRKSAVGQFRKYRGFEPWHAKNYVPQIVGVGLGYRFTDKLAGRAEVVWINLGNLPGANRIICKNGNLNCCKRGANCSPGPALQDATLINLGIGYQFNCAFAAGIGFSHRLKGKQNCNILTHPYRFQTVYDLITVGADVKLGKHDLFFTLTHGFKNRVKGSMPLLLGGERFSAEKRLFSLSFSWGYLY